MSWLRQRRHRSVWRSLIPFAIGLTLSFAFYACSALEPTSPEDAAPTAAQSQTLRIGYQKASTALNLLKSQGGSDS